MNFNIQKIDSFTGHRDCIYTLAHSGNADKFYSAGGDGMVIEWSTTSPDLGKPIVKVANSIYAILSLPQENQLWVANNYEGVHLINTLENKEIGSLSINKSAFFDLKSHNNLLFVLDGTGNIHIIDTPSLSIKKHVKASEKNARTMAINPISNEFAVGYSDNSIKIFDLENFILKKIIAGHKNSVFSVKYINNGQTLVSAGRDAHIMAWAIKHNYEQINDVPAHLYAINDILYLENHNLLATCSMDKSIKLWDASNLKLLKVIDKARFAGHGTSINKLLWLDNTNILLSASDDRTISMWKIF